MRRPGWFRRPRWQRLRPHLAVFVSGMIVACAAVLSFGALAEIGNTAARQLDLFGLQPPAAGYVWAGCVDWFILLGFLNVGDGPRWQVWVAVVHVLLGFGASLAFQLLHAAGIVWPVAVAAVPPVAVFLSLDTWALPKMLGRVSASPAAPGAPSPVPRAAPVAGEEGLPHPGVALAPIPRPRTTVPAGRGTTVKLTPADRRALERVKGDPEALLRIMAKRGIDRGILPPAHAATLNGHRTGGTGA